MILKNTITILLFFFPGIISSFAETDFSKVNLNYLFDPSSEIQFDSKVAVSGKTATVYLKIKLNPNNLDKEAFAYLYEIRKNYTDNEVTRSDSLTNQHIIISEEGTGYFKFDVPVIPNETLVIIKAINLKNNVEYFYDIPIDLPLNFPRSSLLIMEKNRDLPIFKDFISPQDSFRIISVDEKTEEVHFFYYTKEFSAADPPNASKPLFGDKEMNIDSTSTLLLNSALAFPKQGLYFLQTDTTSLEGLSILVKDVYYPQLVKAENLIEPLLYISTAREIKKIKDNKNKKDALDTYWLDLTKSPERAKQIIKSYYQQVELANDYFTTYKEGWKTDQGMILMIFGAPDAVFHHGDYLEWIYERRGSMSRIKFNFTKVKNIFTTNHYELVRNSGYDKDWYRTVDQWRKGRQGI